MPIKVLAFAGSPRRHGNSETLLDWTLASMAGGQVSYHVIEAVDPAKAILDFAAANKVAHVLLGARQSSLRKSLLGSVSAEVAAHAGCSVTIVRPRDYGEEK